MKLHIDSCKVALLHNGASVDTADQSCTEVDIGTCRRGILCLDIRPQTDSDISDIFLTTDREATLTAADEVVDVVGTYVLDSAPTAPVDLTVSSNVFQGIGSGATYMVQCENLERYVQLWYDGRGTTTEFTAILLAFDGQESPHAAARSAY